MNFVLGTTYEGVAGPVIAGLVTLVLVFGGVAALAAGSRRGQGRVAWFIGGTLLLGLALVSGIVTMFLAQCSGGATCFQ